MFVSISNVIGVHTLGRPTEKLIVKPMARIDIYPVNLSKLSLYSTSISNNQLYFKNISLRYHNTIFDNESRWLLEGGCTKLVTSRTDTYIPRPLDHCTKFKVEYFIKYYT